MNYNTIAARSPRSNRSHVNEPALVAHVEGVAAVAEDLAVRRARSGVLADDLSVHTLHASSDGTHVGVSAAGNALREGAGRVAGEGAGDASRWESS
jgi:hypothetical protein